MAYTFQGPTQPITPKPPEKVTPRPLTGRENDHWVHTKGGYHINTTRLSELAAGQP